MKPFYTSKTLWINAIAMMAVLYQLYTGEIMNMEVQAAAIVIINFLLRLVTNEQLE